MKLIVGLGNPGRMYAHNRHNIGFMCVGHLARTHGIRFDKKQGYARTGSGEIAGNKVVLARPQTYMNASGESVSRLVKKLKINPSDLIVIHDDLDLPPGKIRLKRGIGWTTHKGVLSVRNLVGSEDISLVRVGIGQPDIPEDSNIDKDQAVIAYVLSDFTHEEKEIITRAIPEVSRAVLCLLTEGLTSAMNKYN
jgi:PTH1 family peptidyl-tRNA hydrolase